MDKLQFGKEDHVMLKRRVTRNMYAKAVEEHFNVENKTEMEKAVNELQKRVSEIDIAISNLQQHIDEIERKVNKQNDLENVKLREINAQITKLTNKQERLKKKHGSEAYGVIVIVIWLLYMIINDYLLEVFIEMGNDKLARMFTASSEGKIYYDSLFKWFACPFIILGLVTLIKKLRMSNLQKKIIKLETKRDFSKNIIAEYQKELDIEKTKRSNLFQEKKLICDVIEETEHKYWNAEYERRRKEAEELRRREISSAAKKFDDLVVEKRNAAIEKREAFEDLLENTVNLFEHAIRVTPALSYEIELHCVFSYTVQKDSVVYECGSKKYETVFEFKEHRKVELVTIEERLGFAWALAGLVENRMRIEHPQCSMEVKRNKPTDEQKWKHVPISAQVIFEYSCPNPTYEVEKAML